MREIKFRVWLPDGHWAIERYGQMVNDNTSVILFESLGFFTEGVAYMQFTGLKDKNGKGIYEGDIMDRDRLYKGQKTKTEVRWNKINAEFEGCFGKEVIGNIHENPELLNQ